MIGTVIAVRGPVVDVAFADGPLPAIDDALIVEAEAGATGRRGARPSRRTHGARHRHAIHRRARAAARRSRAAGGPITIPVGDAVLGRLIDVLGQCRRQRPGACPPTRRAGPSIARRRALAQQSSSTAVFETGHQGHRSAGADPAGRQGRDVRRRRRRQDRADHGADPCHGGELSGHLGVCRRRRAFARRPRAADRNAQDRRDRPHRAGLWPDERAARRALARRADRADHRRIFPRREASATCCC